VCYVSNNSADSIRVRHLSFSDCLHSRAPSHTRIPESLAHVLSAHECLELIAEPLHFNVSYSWFQYKQNQLPMPDIVTLFLECACLPWIYHVECMTVCLDSETTDTIARLQIRELLRSTLSHW